MINLVNTDKSTAKKYIVVEVRVNDSADLIFIQDTEGTVPPGNRTKQLDGHYGSPRYVPEIYYLHFYLFSCILPICFKRLFIIQLKFVMNYN